MSKRKNEGKEQSLVSVPNVSEGSVKSEANKSKDAGIALEEKIVEVVEQHTEDPSAKHEDLKTKKEVKVEKERPKAEQPKHTCAECKFYDHSTEREFHRDGIRKGLVEVRAVCKASKDISKASNHLVKRESNRPCFEAGVSVAPVKEKKTEKEQPADKKAETKPSETQQTTSTIKGKETQGTERTAREHKTSRKHERPRVASATNVLSGDTKVLETNGHNKKVLVNNIG